MIPSTYRFQRRERVMMGRQAVDQSQLFHLFNLEEHIPADHLLRRINPIVTGVDDRTSAMAAGDQP
jgi:transposase